MLKYVGLRLLMIIPVILGAAVLVFLMIRLLPGDPVSAAFGNQAISAQQLEDMRRSLGLDRPLLVQLGDYVGSLLRGDLGRSLRSGQTVSSIVFSQAPATFQLIGASMLVAVGVGIPLGALAAQRRNTWLDALSMGVAVGGISIPNFWLGLMLIQLFAVTLGWLPALGSTGVVGLILPTVALGVAQAAIVARLVRSSMIEVLELDYVRTARSKGISEFRLMTRHVLRNGLVPVLTMIGLQIGSLLGGAVVIEVVFARQGLGQVVIGGILRRDLPVVQSSILVIAALFVIINLIVDVIYAFVDPRIRLES